LEHEPGAGARIARNIAQSLAAQRQTLYVKTTLEKRQLYVQNNAPAVGQVSMVLRELRNFMITVKL